MSAGQAKRSPTQPQRVEKGRDCTSMPCIDNNVAPNRDSLSVRQRALIAPAARARSDVHKNDDNDDQPDARAFRLASAPAGLLGRLGPEFRAPTWPGARSWCRGNLLRQLAQRRDGVGTRLG